MILENNQKKFDKCLANNIILRLPRTDVPRYAADHNLTLIGEMFESHNQSPEADFLFIPLGISGRIKEKVNDEHDESGKTQET